MNALRSRIALLAACAAALGLALVDREFAPSTAVMLWFFAVVPGSAACRLLRLDRDSAFGWAVAIGASFAIDAIATELMLAAGLWTPRTGVLLLVGIVLAVLFGDELARRLEARA